MAKDILGGKMKEIYKLAYKLYLTGLKKEAEYLDKIIKNAEKKKKCPNCGHMNSYNAKKCSNCGHIFKDSQENDAKDEGKKDACYYKVKSRYDKWPSAYASGALVKCRSVGAKNWGKGKDKKKSKKKKR